MSAIAIQFVMSWHTPAHRCQCSGHFAIAPKPIVVPLVVIEALPSQDLWLRLCLNHRLLLEEGRVIRSCESGLYCPKGCKASQWEVLNTRNGRRFLAGLKNGEMTELPKMPWPEWLKRGM